MKISIPWHELGSEALEALLQDIVTRDGTDYGSIEVSTEQKIKQALQSLKSGKSLLLWDGDLESANLVDKEAFSEN